MDISPQPVTRGLSKKTVSLKIDWLEGSVSESWRIPYPSDLTMEYKDHFALHGYTVGRLYKDGRWEMSNPARPDMGRHVQWSGDALEECPLDAQELLEFEFKAGLSITRLDLAVDAKNWRLKPSRARKEIQLGRCKTRAKKFPFRDDAVDVGDTQYVGKKNSQIFLRVYDKAAEMGVQQDYTRVELSLRAGRAHKAAASVVSNPDFRALVRGYADFPYWNAWCAVMEVDPIKLPKEQRIGNTERWLFNTVAPSLARYHFEHPERGILHQFLERYAQELAEIEAGGLYYVDSDNIQV